MAQPYCSFQNEGTAPPSYVVVDQRPHQEYRFPISLNVKIVFVFAILKCVIGFVEILLGVANIFAVDYFTSVCGFPIWCGLTILVNGVFGCVLKWKQTKCLIATFLALSIASLVLTVMMLFVYAVALGYYVQGNDQICSYDPYSGWTCYPLLSASQQSTGIGLTGFLLFLIISDLGCSIASVTLSCKAYSKCCTTCDPTDCCTCLGCCECDTASLIPHQNTSHQNMMGFHNNGFVPARQLDRQYDSTSHLPPPSNVIGANVVGSNTQYCGPIPSSSNPCSALVNIFLQLPGGSRLISSSNHSADGTTPQNITIQVGPTDGNTGHSRYSQPQGEMNQSSHE